ncbi:MAG: PH domain-containing protein [Cypionkella sp.]
MYILSNRLFMIMEVDETFSPERKQKMDNENPKVQEWENLIRWQRPARRAFADRTVLGALPPLVAAAGLAASPLPGLALVPLALLPIVALRQAFLWRHARHAIDERQIYARRGWLAPRVQVANRAKLQSVEIAQGPLARRGGYATLHLGLAGGTLAFDALPLEEARAMREAILGSIARVDFSKLR